MQRRRRGKPRLYTYVFAIAAALRELSAAPLGDDVSEHLGGGEDFPQINPLIHGVRLCDVAGAIQDSRHLTVIREQAKIGPVRNALKLSSPAEHFRVALLNGRDNRVGERRLTGFELPFEPFDLRGMAFQPRVHGHCACHGSGQGSSGVIHLFSWQDAETAFDDNFVRHR